MAVANANGVSDTINLAAGGIYTLTAVDNLVNGANGLAAIDDDTAGLDLTINGNGATIQRSTAAGTPEFRILPVGIGASASCVDLTIANGKITSGSFPAYAGGGIHNSGTLSLTNCTVRESRGVLGGGIFNHAGVLSLTGCTVHANVADSGGGLHNSEGTLTLRNSTVSGNTANVFGGGLTNYGGESTVQGNTFRANSALEGAAINNKNTINFSARLRIGSTILHSNPGEANLDNVFGVVTSEGYNLSSDNAGGDGNTGPGGLLNGLGDIRNTNPNLGPLQNNGGPTLTHALLSPSAAIDAGDDALLAPPISLTTDQRGAGFPRRKGPRVDTGAVESGVELVVTTTDDHNDGACTVADCTLREAITATNAAGGGTISFAPGVTGMIQLGGFLPDLSTNLLLQGPGANLLTVRRNSASVFRIFSISNGTSNGPVVSITGLTISNGEASGSGGGIQNDHGILLVKECVFTGNHSSPSDIGYGGGIFNWGGSLTIEDSTFTGNMSNYGGGVASSRTNSGSALLFIRGSTFSGNSANGGNGGGIYNEAANAGSSADAFLINCTLSGNSSTASGFVGGAGGAIFNFGSLSGNPRLSLEDCTLSGNNAFSAGGIYNNSFSATAMVTLRNTILKTGAIGENFINSSGSITSLGHNLCNDAAGGLSGTGPGGYLTGVGDMRQTDPLLGPLQNNGGRTLTHALLNGSPAINAGDNNGSDPYDQRGAPRVGTNDIGAFEFGSVAPAPAVLSAVSRKLHGGMPFDIDLPFVGEVGIECRSGGASNDYQVVVSFANAVTYTGASVSFGAGSVSSSTGSGTNSITVNLTGITSGQTSTITLGGVSDGVDTGDVSLLMAVLIGDTNGNGVVNSGDTFQTRNRSGQAADTTNFRSDVNADGFVNSGDTTAVRLRSGTALPPQPD